MENESLQNVDDLLDMIPDVTTETTPTAMAVAPTAEVKNSSDAPVKQVKRKWFIILGVLLLLLAFTPMVMPTIIKIAVARDVYQRMDQSLIRIILQDFSFFSLFPTPAFLGMALYCFLKKPNAKGASEKEKGGMVALLLGVAFAWVIAYGTYIYSNATNNGNVNPLRLEAFAERYDRKTVTIIDIISAVVIFWGFVLLGIMMVTKKKTMAHPIIPALLMVIGGVLLIVRNVVLYNTHHGVIRIERVTPKGQMIKPLWDMLPVTMPCITMGIIYGVVFAVTMCMFSACFLTPAKKPTRTKVEKQAKGLAGKKVSAKENNFANIANSSDGVIVAAVKMLIELIARLYGAVGMQIAKSYEEMKALKKTGEFNQIGIQYPSEFRRALCRVIVVIAHTAGAVAMILCNLEDKPSAPAAAKPVANTENSKLTALQREQLQKLKEAYDIGVLTDEELKDKRKAILGF